MKKTLILFTFFILQFGSVRTQTNPQNIEIVQRFVYYLDNGIERIDLMKVPSISRAFFQVGQPKLIIASKSDPTMKNLLNSYTIVVKSGGVLEETGKAFNMPSPLVTEGCKIYIHVQKPESTITFMEVKLNTTLPASSTPAKYKNPIGTLPVGFFLYLK